MKVVAIVGASGSGKTTAQEFLTNNKDLTNNYVACQQFTTREKRFPEEDCYVFVSEKEYFKKYNDLVGKTKIPKNGKLNYYGTELQYRDDCIQTIVLNDLGLDDFINYAKENHIEYIVLGLERLKVTSEELIGRESRNIEKEKEILERADFTYKFSNDTFDINVLDYLISQQFKKQLED